MSLLFLIGKEMEANLLIYSLVIIFIYFITSLIFEFWLNEHWGYAYGNFGLFGQLSNNAHGYGNIFYSGNSLKEIPFYAIDGQFILYLINPFVHLFGVNVLFFIESVAISFTAFIIWLYCRMLATEKIAILILIVFLFNPGVLGQFVWGYDSTVLGMAFVTLAVFMSRFKVNNKKNYLIIIVLVILSLLSKNIWSLVCIAIGFLWIMKKSNRKLGIVTFILSIFWFYLFEIIILGKIYGGADPNVQGNWGYMGATTAEKIKYLLEHPYLPLHAALEHKKYIFAFLGPFFIGIWNNPLLSLPALIILLMNILASTTPQTNIYTEYSFFVIPFVIIALIEELRNFNKKNTLKTIVYIVLTSLMLLTPTVQYINSWVKNAINDQTSASLNKAVSMIPKNSLVISSNQLGGHLYEFPYFICSSYGVSRIKSMIELYLKENENKSTVLYYLISPNGMSYEDPKSILDVVTWVRDYPNNQLIYDKNNVYLYKVRISNKFITFNTPSSEEYQFNDLLHGAQNYYKLKNNFSNLTPLEMEKYGVLSGYYGGFGRNSNNKNLTKFGGWAGQWFKGYGVGIVTNYSTVLKILNKQKIKPVKVYFPFPDALSQNSNGKTGLFLAVYPPKP
ncbi:DUF2079 domain-containing protein [Fodinisporobacter ferrooxydans]|uniref:DUF2079 domain-containing protein n=1 Tax=Fodinisporobacter ferrooxydans TaxID=2901836 RepID=A0ABY4CLY7_9BACL|nr:DUF2079 domain-containing protein [Alicyclobacillaceae bacterium MYW30-H2]